MRYASNLIERGLVRLSLLVLPLAGLAACDSLLNVEAPSRVSVDVLNNPAAAKLLVDGARAAFGCAFQAYVNGAALLTDEMDDTQLAAAAWDWDRRTWTGALGQAYAESACDAGQIFGVYRPLQTARYASDDAAKRLAAFSDTDVPGRAALQAQASLFAGYSRILLGEGFCSAAIDLGPQLFPQDFFAQAETLFGDAITFATTAGDADLEAAAHLGRARARLDLARTPGQPVNNAKYADAKTDAATIPAGFNYAMPYNTNSSFARNNISFRNKSALLYSVGSNYRNLNDPRVVATNTGSKGADAVSIVWTADKYPTQATPISLARYEEAQMIIAEADLAAGDATGAVTILNTLRGRSGIGLPAYDGPVTVPAVQAFLLTERAKELFLEGQHFWDINRFNMDLSPAAGTAYPLKGGNYGDLRCMPLPDIERLYNPNL